MRVISETSPQLARADGDRHADALTEACLDLNEARQRCAVATSANAATLARLARVAQEAAAHALRAYRTAAGDTL
ncbi:hypothetical protein MMSR116_06000 [Methylobacterium mesophilicum SR1.6/6]|uniref:Uncharacterized protein n=1 Tax=Methylobacterium mesophilicum SR1.6/6 TaxID=908290 RepID=A0A6B9FIA6_9HYPH|nr:hypothetical protein [Methylobacterium mesophilicum]QGY01506.1 hypothetical protein MMSR116_06000 [Methylobacterium mesophilicum SR1.6/6]